MQCEWLSYASGRRESWKCHHTKKAVKRAIAHGSEGLTIFCKGRSATGAVFFIEVPPEDWQELFNNA
ncbi:hypothetical protein ACFTXM_09680 [Streptomyces sp. NPDC056930]|uniref:hypothetical protein n=1 Tax=Streptomyces sp. NPDC056930 TaxID=3345967 RepID=UPI00362C5F5A